ncbi:MAG: hypothetical protein WCD21_10250 [Streptomyces sp.]
MDSTNARAGSFRMIRLTCAISAAAMIIAAVFIWRSAQLESGALIDYVALGLTLAAMAVGGAAWATWALTQRLRTTAGRALGTIVAIAAVVGLSATALSAWAYTDVSGAYARNFGGAGACLAETPYASDRAQLSNGKQVKVSPQAHEQSPSLLFDDAKGDLTPADSHTRRIISEHSC